MAVNSLLAKITLQQKTCQLDAPKDVQSLFLRNFVVIAQAPKNLVQTKFALTFWSLP